MTTNDHNPSPAPPRVSILIPNYNNGRESSINGQIDLIGNLCQSLWDTLHTDPTPFEIIACDDGSTDDSLATLRDWSRKTWPAGSGGAGQPFLELIEREHCGVLSVTANILSRRAEGEFLARLDGDTIMLTPNWVSRLCEVYDNAPPRLAVVGPKQLSPNGKIHSFGDWILHPLGYHHIGFGCERDAMRQPVECDHVMGCFYCCRKRVYEELGGYDEDFLRGQTVDFGLRVRLAGYACIAVPQIEFVHAHGHRKKRQTTADTRDGVKDSMDTFIAKWGFNRIAPDLDYVREKYAGTPLLWNPRHFAGLADAWPEDPMPNPDGQPLDIHATDWVRYTKDQAFKRDMDCRVAVALDVVRQLNDKPAKVALVGAGPGLAVHLLAMAGLPIVATDRHEANLQLARDCLASQTYPPPIDRPQLVQQTNARVLPFDDGELEMLLLFDQLERHPNPVALLAEAHRVLADDRVLIIVGERPGDAQASLTGAQRRYKPHQLLTQVQTAGGFAMLADSTKSDPPQPMVLVVKRVAKPQTDVIDTPPVLAKEDATAASAA